MIQLGDVVILRGQPKAALFKDGGVIIALEGDAVLLMDKLERKWVPKRSVRTLTKADLSIVGLLIGLENIS